jgi:hypothetical protein
MLEPNLAACRDFLVQLGDQIHLASIQSNAGVQGWDFGSDCDAAVAWCQAQNRAGANVYFTVNKVRPGLHRKPRKQEIVSARFAHLDIDPPKDGSDWMPEAALDQLLDTVPQPHLVNWSGNGWQAFWRLPNGTDLDEVEAVNKLLIERFGGDAGTFNCDRLMRVPGLVNYPNERKAAAGRIPALATVERSQSGLISAEKLRVAFQPKAPAKDEPATRPNPAILTASSGATSVSLGLLPCAPLSEAIDRPKGTDRSADTYKVAALMAERGCSVDEIVSILLNPVNRVSDHCLSQSDPDRAARRAAEKALGLRSGERSISRYILYTYEDLQQLPPIEWRVKGVLPAHGLAQIYGPSKSGKTFLALDLAVAIAARDEWFGFRVKNAPVVYLALEGTAGIKLRTEAVARERGSGLPDNLKFVIQPFAVTDPTMRKSVVAETPKGAAIFIDTQFRAAPGADENSSKDMGEIIAGAQAMADAIEGIVILIAHTGKSEGLGPRGHSSQIAAMDAAIHVERRGEERFWTSDKVKEGPDGGSFEFALKTVDLGFDEDGEALSSCVISPMGPATKRGGKSESQSVKASRQAYEAACMAGLGLVQGDGFRGLEKKVWRAEFEKCHLGSPGSAMTRAFNRALGQLRDTGNLEEDGDVCRLTDPASALFERDYVAATGQPGQLGQDDILKGS